MDEAIEFIRGFIQKEYEAALALYGERDEGIFKQKVDAVLAYLDPSERIQVDLIRKPNERWFRIGATVLPETIPRPLFKAAWYLHPALGELFRFYVGNRRVFPKVSYAESLYVGHTADGLRIVSQYPRCPTCYGASAANDTRCSECDSAGFIYLSGIRLPDLGAPLEVRKFDAPTDPVALAEYNKS